MDANSEKARSAGLAANEAGSFDEAYRLLLPLAETGDVEIQARAMRLPRMTTRRWMIAVAVVALLIGGSIGGYRLKRFHDLFLDRAEYHAMMEVARRKSEHAHRELGLQYFGFDSASSRAVRAKALRDIEFFSRAAIHHAEMARKYGYAAQNPWLPVAADPPEPPLPSRL